MSSVVFILRVYRILYWPQSNATRGFATGGVCHASNTRYFLCACEPRWRSNHCRRFPLRNHHAASPLGWHELLDCIWWRETDSNQRRFSIFGPSDVIPTAIFPFSRYIRPLWGPRFWGFSKGPEKGPQNRPAVRELRRTSARPRTTERCFSISFPGVTCFSSGFPDVGGRHGKSAEVGRLATELPI